MNPRPLPSSLLNQVTIYFSVTDFSIVVRVWKGCLWYLPPQGAKKLRGMTNDLDGETDELHEISTTITKELPAELQHFLIKNTEFTLFTFGHNFNMLRSVLIFLNLRRWIHGRKG